MTIEADRMSSPSASTFLEKPSGAQYKRTKTKSKCNLAKYLRLAAAFVTRATCVISGRTVGKTNALLGYYRFKSPDTFPPQVGETEKVIKPFVLRVREPKQYNGVDT